MQRQITEITDLLDKNGKVIQPGYAKKMLYRYNRDRIHANPFALKEWDFYQISGGDWVLQMTIGHVSYAVNYSSTLFNIHTGERRTFSRLKAFPMRNIPMPLNPEEPYSLEGKGKGYRIAYNISREKRVLTLEAQEEKTGRIKIEVEIANNPNNEKMVIATPFAKPNQFYLNYKENYYAVKGTAAFGDLRVEFGSGYTALLDWGRGVWPFTQEWFWGNGTGFSGGKKFGFNIGWGFGDTSMATENMFFYEGKAYKLGGLKAERDEKDYMKPWRFTSDDGSFDLNMTPVYDNHTMTNIAFIIKTGCHQVHGLFNGTVRLPNGSEIKITNLLAFCEHAINRW